MPRSRYNLAVRLVWLSILIAARAGAEPERVVIADLGLHVVGAGYQLPVASHVALQLDLESYTPWTQEARFFELQGIAVRGRPVFYANADAVTRWWLSPFAQVGIGWAKRDGTRRSGVVSAAGVSVGYAWLLWAHVHVALGAGVQYDDARIPGGSSKPSFASLWPQLDGTLGYAF
jgi:hypothetical protein